MRAAHRRGSDRQGTMFGKKRPAEAWARDTSALGMSETDDWESALGGSLAVLSPVPEARSETAGFASLDTGVLGYVATMGANVKQSSVNKNLRGPGLIGAFTITFLIALRGPLRSRQTHMTGVQVIVTRLRRPIAEPILAVPNDIPWAKKDHDKRRSKEQGLQPVPLAHNLLGPHLASLTGLPESELLTNDEQLAALLWTMRPKMHNEKERDREVRQRLESLMPPAPRLKGFELLEIRGDLLALARQHQWPSIGLNSDVVALLNHVTAYFR